MLDSDWFLISARNKTASKKPARGKKGMLLRELIVGAHLLHMSFEYPCTPFLGGRVGRNFVPRPHSVLFRGRSGNEIRRRGEGSGDTFSPSSCYQNSEPQDTQTSTHLRGRRTGLQKRQRKIMSLNYRNIPQSMSKRSNHSVSSFIVCISSISF